MGRALQLPFVAVCGLAASVSCADPHLRALTPDVPAQEAAAVALFGRWEPGFEAAYALGGAVGDRSGFRQGFDGSVRLAFLETGKDAGPLLGAHTFVGFNPHPTAAGVEFGLAGKREPSRHSPLAAVNWGISVGPEVRVDPDIGWGASARISGGPDPVQLGVRLIAIAAPHSEVMLLTTIGFARF
jgi:hypothetical protein